MSRTYVAEHATELAAGWALFERVQQKASTGASGDLRSEIGQVMSAVWQIVSQGSDTQRRADPPCRCCA